MALGYAGEGSECAALDRLWDKKVRERRGVREEGSAGRREPGPAKALGWPGGLRWARWVLPSIAAHFREPACAPPSVARVHSNDNGVCAGSRPSALECWCR